MQTLESQGLEENKGWMQSSYANLFSDMSFKVSNY